MGKITGTYGTGDSAADFKADGNVNRIGDAVGAKSVKYEHVADAYADYLARNLNTDAANYTVAKDTFYKESDNKGKINPVILSDIKAKWQGVDKVYDATANVLNPENTMKLVTKDTVLTGNEIELTYTGAASGVYVDSNGLQLDGPVAEIMPLGDIAGKFAAFGFETWNINGNDMAEVVDALEQATSAKDGKPKAIVGKTVKGNGVSFMENQVGWHGKAPNEEQCRQALAELDAAYVK